MSMAPPRHCPEVVDLRSCTVPRESVLFPLYSMLMGTRQQIEYKPPESERLSSGQPPLQCLDRET
eukprot:3842427-Prymnesium_polylepis.2